MKPRAPDVHIAAVALAIAFFLISGAARADAAADKRAAQTLLSEGNELAGAGDYLEALEKFRTAYARYRSPKILLNIGTSLRQLGRNVEAAEAYEQYLADPNAEASRKADLVRMIGEIDAVVGRMRIEVREPDAAVRLDGKPLDAWKGTVFRVEPGEHTVVASKEGFAPVLRTVRVAPREDLVVRLDLRPPEKTVVVVPISTTQRTVALTVGSVGIAGIVAGSIFGALAKARSEAAQAHCLARVDCDAEGTSLGSTASTFATASTAAFVGGGAAVAAGIPLFVTAPSAAAAPAQLSTSVGSRGGFLRVGGAF